MIISTSASFFILTLLSKNGDREQEKSAWQTADSRILQYTGGELVSCERHLSGL
jgi:hypothetical protein